MTVGELKEILKTLSDGQEIVMSIDEERDDAFHPLDECTIQWYFPNWREVRSDEDVVEDELHYRVLVLRP